MINCSALRPCFVGGSELNSSGGSRAKSSHSKPVRNLMGDSTRESLSGEAGDWQQSEREGRNAHGRNLGIATSREWRRNQISGSGVSALPAQKAKAPAFIVPVKRPAAWGSGAKLSRLSGSINAHEGRTLYGRVRLNYSIVARA